MLVLFMTMMQIVEATLLEPLTDRSATNLYIVEYKIISNTLSLQLLFLFTLLFIAGESDNWVILKSQKYLKKTSPVECPSVFRHAFLYCMHISCPFKGDFSR